MKRIEPIKLKISWDLDGPCNSKLKAGDIKLFDGEDDEFYYFICGHGAWFPVDKNCVEPVEEEIKNVYTKEEALQRIAENQKLIDALNKHPQFKAIMSGPNKATGCDGCKHENCGSGLDSLGICLDCENYESYEPHLENAAMAVGRKWMKELVKKGPSQDTNDGNHEILKKQIELLDEKLIENPDPQMVVTKIPIELRDGKMTEYTTPEEPNYEYVDKPDHYKGDEVMKIIEKFELGFHLGNVVKYILRCGKKPGEDTLKDLEKARWYLNREIENIYKSKV